MNLIDENYNKNTNNRKIFIICGTGIVVLLFIIIALLAVVTTLNGKQIKLTVDGKSYSSSDYLINKENVLYIGIEDLTKITKNGYSFKSGSKDVEDDNKCYITNSYESTFFEVNSNEIYKVLEETNETEYYTLENPIIKENNKIYMPLSAVTVAANSSYRSGNNQIVISSITHLESFYNKQKTTTFIPNSSIVWENTYSNKKLLKHNLVVTTDESGNYGIGKISYTTSSGKTKVTTVQVESIIDAKYLSIRYVEKFNQLIVETQSGMGIIQLQEENSNITAKTTIVPQYESIKQIASDLYLVSEKSNINTSSESTNSTSSSTIKYGIVNEDGDTILPIEYDKIGFDVSKFTNNDLNSEYIIYDRYIPVKKGDLWGFINLTGKVVIKLEYSGIGCVGTNSSSNVLIIPEIDGIVVRKDKNYGVISNSGKVLIKNILTRVYKETSNGEEVYTMVYNGEKHNVIEYIKEQSKKNNNTTNKNNNTVNTTTTQNKTNTNNGANSTTNKTSGN